MSKKGAQKENPEDCVDTIDTVDTYTWTIKQISHFITLGSGQYILSDIFTMCGLKFFFKFFPNGKSEHDKGCVGIDLCIVHKFPITKWQILLNGSLGFHGSCTIEKDTVFCYGLSFEDAWGWRSFVKTDDLQKNQEESDLSIVVKIASINIIDHDGVVKLEE